MLINFRFCPTVRRSRFFFIKLRTPEELFTIEEIGRINGYSNVFEVISKYLKYETVFFLSKSRFDTDTNAPNYITLEKTTLKFKAYLKPMFFPRAMFES